MKISQFKLTIEEKEVMLDVVQLKEQVYLYIGDSDRRFDDLQLILQTKIQEKPLQREIHSNSTIEEEIKSIAESVGLFLARKKEIAVFYSFNLKIKETGELLRIMKQVKTVVLEEFSEQKEQ